MKFFWMLSASAMILVLVCFVVASQRVELVISRECISGVGLKDKGECRGPDKDHLVCEGLVITYKPECASWRIVNDKK